MAHRKSNIILLAILTLFSVQSLLAVSKQIVLSATYKITLIINYDTIRVDNDCNLLIKHNGESVFFEKQKMNVYSLHESDLEKFITDSLFFKYKTLSLYICKGLYQIRSLEDNLSTEIPITIRIADHSHFLDYDPQWIDTSNSKQYKRRMKKFSWAYFVAWPSIRWTYAQTKEIPKELIDHKNVNYVTVKKISKHKLIKELGNDEFILFIGGEFKDYKKKYFRDSSSIMIMYYNTQTDKFETQLIRNVISYNYDKKYLVVKCQSSKSFLYTIIEKKSKKVFTTADFDLYIKEKYNRNIYLDEGKNNFASMPYYWFLEEIPKSNNRIFFITVCPR